MLIFVFFISRRVNLYNNLFCEVNKKTEVKNQKDLLKNGKEPRRMKKSLITHQIGEDWELLLRQADQDNGKKQGQIY